MEKNVLFQCYTFDFFFCTRITTIIHQWQILYNIYNNNRSPALTSESTYKIYEPNVYEMMSGVFFCIKNNFALRLINFSIKSRICVNILFSIYIANSTFR